ncbi:MAG: family 16 glycoside hydrolase [Candidatus Poribacteria bacterium]
MKIILMLCVLMIAMPAFAGTFRDDFDDGDLDGWKFDVEGDHIEVKSGKVETADCKIYAKDGEAIIMDYEASIASGIDFNNGLEIRDFTLTVDGKMTEILDKSRTWDYIYVLGRCTDTVCAWSSLEARGNIPLVILTWAGGNLQNIARLDFAFPFELNRWYHIQVEMKGSKLSVSVDNKLICSNDWVNQPILPKKGYVSIGAGGAEVHFDNFVITGDDVPDNSISVESKGKLTTTWGEIRRGK